MDTFKYTNLKINFKMKIKNFKKPDEIHPAQYIKLR